MVEHVLHWKQVISYVKTVIGLFICYIWVLSLSRYEDYPVPDVLQMVGRANRPITDNEGKIKVVW